MNDAMFYVLLDEAIRDVGRIVTAAEFAGTLPDLKPEDAEFLRDVAKLMEGKVDERQK